MPAQAPPRAWLNNLNPNVRPQSAARQRVSPAGSGRRSVMKSRPLALLANETSRCVAGRVLAMLHRCCHLRPDHHRPDQINRVNQPVFIQAKMTVPARLVTKSLIFQMMQNPSEAPHGPRLFRTSSPKLGRLPLQPTVGLETLHQTSDNRQLRL